MRQYGRRARSHTPANTVLLSKCGAGTTGPLNSENPLLLLKFYGDMIFLGPILVHAQVRFKGNLNPQLVPVESLLQHAAAWVQHNF
jgi:hypothetical protein